MNFKTPFKVLTTAALIGTLSLSAITPGSASAAEPTEQGQNQQTSFTLDQIVLVKGDSKVSITPKEFALNYGSAKLNGYELAYVVSGDKIYSKNTYALNYKDNASTTFELLSKTDKAEDVKDIVEGSFTGEDGKLVPAETETEAAKKALDSAIKAAEAKEIKDATAKKDLEDAIKAAKDAAAKEDATKEELEAAKAELAKAVEKAEKADAEAALEAKVESVTAINAKTVEVKFTQPVKKSTVVDGNGKLVATNVSFSTLETPLKTITGASADAELSEDGKTLTITAPTTEVFEGRYQVVVNNVETTKSDKFPKFDEIVNLGKDTTAPAVASVEKVNASTSKVTFSEAIANLGTAAEVTYSYKLADGTSVPTADVTVTPAADGKSITVFASAAKYAGKTITATILGAKDHAGNLINPNPSTFNFQIGEKDGVAPTIASSKAVSPTQIEVNFSEEVQGFATAVPADADSRVKLTGASGKISSSVTATKIEQDKTDKKKYIVTLSGSALDGVTVSSVADLKVNKTITLSAGGTSTITDLSGEEIAADYTAIVTVKKDTVAPKHVATKVIEEAGVQWLVLDFDEELNATVGTAVAPVASTATSFKDFVTVSGKNVALGSSLALTDDKKGVKVKMSDVTFDSSPLVDGTKYTFDLKATDAAGNASSAIGVEFTFNGKADSDKPALVTPVSITGTGQDTIVLEFDKELDGASATNAANYKVAGVTVEKAVLAAVSGGKQKVTLTLAKNEQSGDRAITISGVKSKAGVAMDTFNGTVTLKENVKPTVTAAKVIATDKIELTFSENVVLTGTTNFDVFLGESTVAETGVATVAETTGKTVITLATPLTEADLAKTITVKPTAAADVKDAAGNVLDFKSIVVTK